MKDDKENQGKVWTEWFDLPESRRKLWKALWVTCALTLVAEIFIKRKAYFGFDGIFGFYALLGFLACAGMILSANGLGLFVKRGEDYYGDAEPPSVGSAAKDEAMGGDGDD